MSATENAAVGGRAHRPSPHVNESLAPASPPVALLRRTVQSEPPPVTLHPGDLPPGSTTWACDHPEGRLPDSAYADVRCHRCVIAYTAAAVNEPHRHVIAEGHGSVPAPAGLQLVADRTDDPHVTAALRTLNATSAPPCGSGAHRRDARSLPTSTNPVPDLTPMSVLESRTA